MPTVMKIVPFYDKARFVADVARGIEPEWLYLRDYDLEAYGGRGKVTTTADKRKALQFPNEAAAMDAWRSQSKTMPIRPDGRPNRPLTAYHATFEELDAGGS